MLNDFVDFSPGDEPDGERSDQIAWFWKLLFTGENPGETTWEGLEKLRAEVEGALMKVPPDVSKAETLTAYAMFLISGDQSL
jgi:hypothetical protein